MRLRVVAIGRVKDGPERELLARYLDRAGRAGRALGFSGFDIVEIGESKAARSADRKAEEGRETLAAAPRPFICLDERGRGRDSQAFALDLRSRRDRGEAALAFVIGGADGLDAAVLAGADAVLSFGAMTLPHQLVRILLAEQLYRAMTILAGHPYHRA